MDRALIAYNRAIIYSERQALTRKRELEKQIKSEAELINVCSNGILKEKILSIKLRYYHDPH